MPKVSAKALEIAEKMMEAVAKKRPIKSGVETAEDFMEALAAGRPTRLYRATIPDKIWQPLSKFKAPTWEEPAGRYWALDPQEILPLLRPGDWGGRPRSAWSEALGAFEEHPSSREFYNLKALVEEGLGMDEAAGGYIFKTGRPARKLKVRNLSDPDDWKSYLNHIDEKTRRRRTEASIAQLGGAGISSPLTRARLGRYMTKDLQKEGYDLVIFPDLAAGQPEVVQAVQLSAKTLATRAGKRHGTRLIMIPAGVAAGLGLMGGQDEAEAAKFFPVGAKLTKKAKDAVMGVLSEGSTKALAGRTFRNQVIKEVRKGSNPRYRAVIFDDGSMATLTTKEVEDLCRYKGTEDYLDAFREAGRTEKVDQAMRSYEHRKKRLGTALQSLKQAYHKSYVESTEHLVGGHQEHLFVDDGIDIFPMPKPYAEVLEEIGVVKIRRDKKYMKAVKPEKAKPRPGG